MGPIYFGLLKITSRLKKSFLDTAHDRRTEIIKAERCAIRYLLAKQKPHKRCCMTDLSGCNLDQGCSSSLGYGTYAITDGTGSIVSRSNFSVNCTGRTGLYPSIGLLGWGITLVPHNTELVKICLGGGEGFELVHPGKRAFTEKVNEDAPPKSSTLPTRPRRTVTCGAMGVKSRVRSEAHWAEKLEQVLSFHSASNLRWSEQSSQSWHVSNITEPKMHITLLNETRTHFNDTTWCGKFKTCYTRYLRQTV